MRIVLDLTPLVTTSARRGIGRYVRGLVQGFSELAATGRSSGLHFTGLAATPALDRLYLVDDLIAYCQSPAPVAVQGADRRRNRLITRSAARAVPPDAFLHLTDPKGIPFSRELRYSATAHDLIALALPRLYLPPVPQSMHVYAAIERFRYRRVRGVIAVSHATKRDLCQFLGVPPERVRVVWHGVDHERFHPQDQPHDAGAVTTVVGGADPYVLYVGAGDARKDLDTLVDAFAASRLRHVAKLVLAGRFFPWRNRSLRRRIAARRLDEQVVLAGYVAEEHLPALYRRARVHAFLSRYEGFGLPVLEALACGTPTVTSPGSSLDEVAGDAACVVPCGDPDALATVLDQLFFDEELRVKLRARGIERAAQFTWAACALQTTEFLKQVSA